ncbi:MAG: MCE family protein [Paludibacteraceae bacterium]|nr:MCE family protein [Paludibacteraceae bacterium]
MKFKFSRELWIGALVIATVAVLYFGVNYLKGINIFNPTNYYYVKFDRVNGLSVSSPITIKGYKIGLIKDIIYNYDDPKDGIVVVLQVDDDLRIPVNSRAVLTSELLGGANVSLTLNAEMNGVFYKKGDTIPSFIDDGIMATVTAEIMPRVQSIVPQLDSLLVSLKTIAGDQAIQKSLGNIQRLTANLESASVSLKGLMKNDVPVIMKNVNTITTDFSKVSANLSHVDFQATMKRVDNTLANLQTITDKVNRGEGTVGMLLNDKTLYNNLANTAGSANELLIDLKANPKRYVQFSLWGKKDKSESK